MALTWDYTELAEFYDKRANYSAVALERLVSLLKCKKGDTVADIGAGTGKLTVPMLKYGLHVIAVEPNDTMRSYGIKNTMGQDVVWRIGTGEKTSLDTESLSAFLMGSSFNVVDQAACLTEAYRTLKLGGWFACMWNHRDLDDEHQARIESIIRQYVPNYSHGNRREDPTNIIVSSDFFDTPKKIEERFIEKMAVKDIIDAWKSHATLQKQAGKAFDDIIKAIEKYLSGLQVLNVPYHTRIWASRRKN